MSPIKEKLKTLQLGHSSNTKVLPITIRIPSYLIKRVTDDFHGEDIFVK